MPTSRVLFWHRRDLRLADNFIMEVGGSDFVNDDGLGLQIQRVRDLSADSLFEFDKIRILSQLAFKLGNLGRAESRRRGG